MGCCDAAAQVNYGGYMLTPTGRRSDFFYNEPNVSVRGDPTNLRCSSGFRDRLNGWLNESEVWMWAPGGTEPPDNISTLGAYKCRNDGCVSRHNYGNAFDLSRLEWIFERAWYNDNYNSDKKFTMGIEAMCHRHFRDTLGYHYNDAHHNHIHFDDAHPIGFSSGSPAQVKFVQASLTHVWGYSVPITGTFDPTTQWYAQQVTGSICSGMTFTSPEGWRCYGLITCYVGTAQ